VVGSGKFLADYGITSQKAAFFESDINSTIISRLSWVKHILSSSLLLFLCGTKGLLEALPFGSI
jgi:hypothetical protein